MPNGNLLVEKQCPNIPALTLRDAGITLQEKLWQGGTKVGKKINQPEGLRYDGGGHSGQFSART